MIATVAVVLSSGPVSASPAGGTCSSGQVCVSSLTGYDTFSPDHYYDTDGQVKGYTTSPWFYASTEKYSNGDLINNNIRSVRGRSSTYVSFCIYANNDRTGLISGGSNIWAFNGYRNVASSGGSSGLRRTATTCVDPG